MIYFLNRKRILYFVAVVFGAIELLSGMPSASAAPVTCSTVAACLMGVNTKNGPGVEGLSFSSYGVLGVSSSGPGLEGMSTTDFGLVGDTMENASSVSTARAGVLGQDKSTNNNVYNSGVAGVSTHGIGVLGQGGTYGGSFTSAAGQAVLAHSSLGYGVYTQSDQSIGLVSFSLGSADSLYSAALGAQGGSAVHAVAAGSSQVLVGTNAGSEQDVVSIDSAGNEILAGSLTQSGQPEIRTRTVEGKTLMSYGERSGAPVLEDFGTGMILSGRGYVRIDHAFATAMDSHVPYMVFLSPEGDNRGLYVTGLTNQGFSVRESNGGRSNLTFCYRLVAKPYDTDTPRFSMTSRYSGLHRSRTVKHLAL